MRNRVLPFFGLLIFWVVTFIVGGTTLYFGYELSDVLYDAGLWPIGAMLRIGLLFELLGWGLTLLVIPFMAIAALVVGTDK